MWSAGRRAVVGVDSARPGPMDGGAGHRTDGRLNGPADAQVADRGDEHWQRLWSHREELLKVARRRSATVEDAEDAVHEAIVRAAEHPDVDDERLGAWLTTVTMRLCVDRHRQVRRDDAAHSRTALAPCAPVPVDEAVCDRAEAEWLADRSKELPARQARALRLKSDGRDVDQIAREMGLSYEAVESLLARARRALRRSLAGTMTLALWLWERGRGVGGGGVQVVATASAASAATVAVLVVAGSHPHHEQPPGPAPVTTATYRTAVPAPSGRSPDDSTDDSADSGARRGGDQGQAAPGAARPGPAPGSATASDPAQSARPSAPALAVLPDVTLPTLPTEDLDPALPGVPALPSVSPVPSLPPVPPVIATPPLPGVPVTSAVPVPGTVSPAVPLPLPGR